MVVRFISQIITLFIARLIAKARWGNLIGVLGQRGVALPGSPATHLRFKPANVVVRWQALSQLAD